MTPGLTTDEDVVQNLDNVPPCPSSFRFLQTTGAAMQADLSGIKFELYSDPNYPAYGVINSATFGMSITLPNDIIFMPTNVKIAIEYYLGDDLYTGPMPDLRIITGADNNQHLLISPRALALISTRAVYETSYDIKTSGAIAETLVYPNGASLLKNQYKTTLLNKLSYIVPGATVQAFTGETNVSRKMQMAHLDLLTGRYICP